MKRFSIILAAVAALVGCSRNEELVVDAPRSQMSLVGSITDDATRVTVDGEKFNEVSWVAGDMIRLASEAGIEETTLRAAASGKRGILFEGEGAPVADIDTYYAIYPATVFDGSRVSFDYANQSGEDVAALAGKVEGVAADDIAMSFKPVNALLHVTISGVTMLSSAELMSYSGEALASGFSYDFATDTTTLSDTTTASYVIDSPDPAGFFFQLPADLDLSEGYIIRFTDATMQRNSYMVAYNGKLFERGTTTRVSATWAIPSVTLGAKTSYSYHVNGDSASADKCGNTTIYFTTGVNGEDCSSSYANIQDALISDLGYKVGNTTYTYSAGQVSWNKENNTFCIKTAPAYDTSWGKCDVTAFVEVNGERLYAKEELWLTGLPYHADWRSRDYSDWIYTKIADKGSYLRVDNASWFSSVLGCIISPEFKMPSSLSVYSAIAASTGATSAGDYDRSYCYAGARSATPSESGTYVTIAYMAADSNNPDTGLVCIDSPITLTTSAPCVVHTAKDFSPTTSTNIYQVKITYSKQ